MTSGWPRRRPKLSMKDEYRRWLSTLPFHWNIVVEPDAKKEFNLARIKDRLCRIEFELNKRHLGSRFTKLDRRDRFQFACFQQGEGSDRHVHILLYVPSSFKQSDSSFRRRMLLKDLRYWWLKDDGLASLHELHYTASELKLYARPTRTVAGSVIYNSRYIDLNFESDDFFFIHP
jgi:hypothetical protein